MFCLVDKMLGKTPSTGFGERRFIYIKKKKNSGQLDQMPFSDQRRQRRLPGSC